MLDLCLGVLGSVMDRSKSSFNILNKTFGFVKVSDVRCYTDISDKSEAFVSPFRALKRDVSDLKRDVDNIFASIHNTSNISF